MDSWRGWRSKLLSAADSVTQRQLRKCKVGGNRCSRSASNARAYPELVKQFSHPRLAMTTVKALAKFGPRVQNELIPILDDLTQPPELRAHLARVLARLDSPESAELLAEHLADESIHVRLAVVQALTMLVANRPEMPIELAASDQAILNEAKLWYRLLFTIEDLEVNSQIRKWLRMPLEISRKVWPVSCSPSCWIEVSSIDHRTRQSQP